MPRRPEHFRPVPLALAVLACALLALPAGASASRLVGGREQSAITRAFLHQPASKGKAIVSIRSSATSPAWTIVRWVFPAKAGRGGTGSATPRLHATFFRAGKGGAAPGRPPARVARELSAAFRVTILYTGSGSERINYSQTYRSVCSGGGGFVEQERDTVSPLSWRVRYTVDLDRLLSAVRGPQGLVLVPTVAFDPAGSRLSATERRSRTYVDQGCFNRPTNYTCVTSFHFASGGGSDLGFLPGAGAEIGIPMRASGRGRCAPEDYTLGPSLWASGAATALVRSLGLLGGGRLPANPYARQKVSWPGNSAPAKGGVATSPCSGIGSSCSDRFNWRGSIRLQAASSR
jgi:hypothetical protein